jgi:hypothetical protein
MTDEPHAVAVAVSAAWERAAPVEWPAFPRLPASVVLLVLPELAKPPALRVHPVPLRTLPGLLLPS